MPPDQRKDGSAVAASLVAEPALVGSPAADSTVAGSPAEAAGSTGVAVEVVAAKLSLLMILSHPDGAQPRPGSLFLHALSAAEEW